MKPITIQIMTCRPADLTDLPNALREVLENLPVAPLEDPTERTCETCGMRVLMGRRQSTLYELSPDEFAVACWVCTAQAHAKVGMDNTTVHHLGGA